MKKIFYVLLCAMLLVTVGCEKNDGKPDDGKDQGVTDTKKYAANDKEYFAGDLKAGETAEVGLFKIAEKEVTISYGSDVKQGTLINIGNKSVPGQGFTVFNDELVVVLDEIDGTGLLTRQFYDINGNKVGEYDGYFIQIVDNKVVVFDTKHRCDATENENGRVYMLVYEYKNDKFELVARKGTNIYQEDVQCSKNPLDEKYTTIDINKEYILDIDKVTLGSTGSVGKFKVAGKEVNLDYEIASRKMNDIASFKIDNKTDIGSGYGVAIFDEKLIMVYRKNQLLLPIRTFYDVEGKETGKFEGLFIYTLGDKVLVLDLDGGMCDDDGHPNDDKTVYSMLYKYENGKFELISNTKTNLQHDDIDCKI